jgi:hypothetical protein
MEVDKEPLPECNAIDVTFTYGHKPRDASYDEYLRLLYNEMNYINETPIAVADDIITDDAPVTLTMPFEYMKYSNTMTTAYEMCADENKTPGLFIYRYYDPVTWNAVCRYFKVKTENAGGSIISVRDWSKLSAMFKAPNANRRETILHNCYLETKEKYIFEDLTFQECLKLHEFVNYLHMDELFEMCITEIASRADTVSIEKIQRDMGITPLDVKKVGDTYIGVYYTDEDKSQVDILDSYFRLDTKSDATIILE